MEKQPVDDLFARKLREAEVNVNPDAFAQLQQRMGVNELPRKKLNSFWRYIAAASFLGAITVGYVVNTNEELAIAKQDQAAGRIEQPRQGVKNTDKAKPKTVDGIDSQKLEIALKPENRYVHLNRSVNVSKTNKATELSPSPAEESAKTIVATKSTEQKEVPSEMPRLTAIGQPMRIATTQKSVTDRTIILTIDEPQLVTSRVDMGPVSVDEVRPHGFSGLLGKLRQLKNGETFARATPGVARTSAAPSLERTFTELKESLKNETTLDQ